MEGTGQHRCKKGICTWVLRGALTGLGKVGTVRMYPILIRCVFVSVCGYIRGVGINDNQSITQRVREKIPVPIGRVLNRPGCLANVTICGNKHGVKIGWWHFPEMKLFARRDGCHEVQTFLILRVTQPSMSPSPPIPGRWLCGCKTVSERVWLVACLRCRLCPAHRHPTTSYSRTVTPPHPPRSP